MASIRDFIGENEPILFNFKEYAIGGKLFSVTVSLEENKFVVHQFDELWKKEMRKSLVSHMVEEMLNRNFVEITSKLDPITHQRLINARCYLAPNDQVKIIRTFDNDKR